MKYDPKSPNAEEFINDEEILETIEFGDKNSHNRSLIKEVLNEAAQVKGLDHRKAYLLLACEEEDLNEEIYKLARKIKQEIYGNRIVLFAPLYLSNYCINSCSYCPYHVKNKVIPRKILSMEDIRRETLALQDMGHKRLAIESGEDPIHSPIEYILDAIRTIYSTKHKNGSIRRVNVNIAATTVEEYRMLKDVGIGTYILFQETYNKKSYETLHPAGPKSNYSYHTEAMDRAMDGGIDDVGCGVLYGLNNYKYELVGQLMHKEHLEARFGVGPHTFSVPRVKPAQDIDPTDFDNSLSDDMFEKIVAVLRVSTPYVGMIISTRESEEMRGRVLDLGISQISGASKTSVGGYAEEDRDKDISSAQFDTFDQRSLDEVISRLMDLDHIPSFCTACYRAGRTGDRFMSFAKSGEISNYCTPNALMTLKEYLEDYAGPETKAKGEEVLLREVEKIPNDLVREKTKENFLAIANGGRDFRF